MIVGPTMCGKTTLAMGFASQWLANGRKVLVCDPLQSDWPATWQTTDRAALVALAKRSLGCALICDEAGQTIARDPEAEWLVTTARHWGHKTTILSHGGTQMTPTMRGQFSTVFLFGSTPRVAELWAEEFNEPGLLHAVTLPRFEYLVKTRYQPLRRQILTA